jgi:hypothetical protein
MEPLAGSLEMEAPGKPGADRETWNLIDVECLVRCMMIKTMLPIQYQLS